MVQELRPIPMDIYWHDGIFYMLTHTALEDEEEQQEDGEWELVPDFGRLSLWDGEGRLLVSHALQQGPRALYRCCHPNGPAFFSA